MPYGTSTWQARIAVPTGQPADYSAVGPVMAGDWGANNVNHYSDVMAQRRACWTNAGYALASVQTEQWRPLWSTGEFPIALHADGSSYHVRIKLAGSVGGGGTETTKWAVVLAPQGSARSVLQPGSLPATTDAVWISANYANSAVAWMTGVSQGPNAWTTQVALTAAEATRYSRSVASLTDVAGSAASVRQCLVSLSIFAWQKSAADPPSLNGFVADEWPG